MSDSADRTVSRRVLLGGAAAGIAGAGLAPAWAADAHDGPEHKPVDREAVAAVAARLDHDLIELRRDIHAHPEASGQEQRTAGLVAQRLRAAGLDVVTGVGGYGVVAVLTGAHHGRTVAYRADMDAVSPNDQIGGGTQVAHLCGHDIHTTVGVGVAQVLARLRHRLAGTVVFVFQPAEESLTGAAAMLGDGVLSTTRPTEIHALHCGPFPVGQFVSTAGFGLPGQDRGTATLTGADAEVRAQRLAANINALGTVSPPATTQDRERFIADLQTPNGPLAKFVFMTARASGAEVRVVYRCWPADRSAEIRQEVDRLAQSDGPATVAFPNDPFPAMVCPEREGRALQRYLRQALGRDRVRALQAAIPFNGEDFALFLDRIPGTFTFLGVRTPGAAIETSYPHMVSFVPDERAIGHGVRAMAGWLAQRTRT